MSQFGSDPPDPGHLGFDKPRLARLKRWMQRYADTGRWPGGAVLIARHGELAFFDCAGHADVEAKRPWQRDLIARIYSMTKPVTAVALMMLYEEPILDRTSAASMNTGSGLLSLTPCVSPLGERRTPVRSAKRTRLLVWLLAVVGVSLAGRSRRRSGHRLATVE
uniref:serine hydrolase domain-containing protein n=1 Tax=Rhizobium sp. F40D2 TaxID=3453141 RepID=UPI003F288437